MDLNKKVRVYDVEKQKYYFMPACELSETMIRARIEGSDDVVWVDTTQLKPQAGTRHKTLSAWSLNEIKMIKQYLDDVYFLTFEEWEEGFKYDEHPEAQIIYWTKVGKIYAALKEYVGADEACRKDLLNIILSASKKEDSEVSYYTLDLKTIAKRDALALIEKVREML